MVITQGVKHRTWSLPAASSYSTAQAGVEPKKTGGDRMSETPKMSNARRLTFYRLLTISTAQRVEPLGEDLVIGAFF